MESVDYVTTAWALWDFPLWNITAQSVRVACHMHFSVIFEAEVVEELVELVSAKAKVELASKVLLEAGILV